MKKNVLRFLQASEAARLAGVTPAGINAAAKHGRLRVAAITGRNVRLFNRADVLAYAATCRRGPW